MELHPYFVVIVRILGLAAAISAIMRTRSSQAAVAWAVGLISYPYVALPLYSIFGFGRFKGYVRARRINDDYLRHSLTKLQHQVPRLVDEPPTASSNVFSQLAGLPWTRTNQLELLIDGAATFRSIEQAIDAAEISVLVQFYIVRDDGVGGGLFAALERAAKRGVLTCLLYDSLGSSGLSRRCIKRLRTAGIQCAAFRSTKGPRSRIQANFRNHRKNVIVDGKIALIGGHNVGDEYVGLNPKLGHWRDTHLRIAGPAATEAQITFVEDWYWSTGSVPRLSWEVDSTEPDGAELVVLPSGPADPFDTCELMFAHAINMAERRIWISTPYFVPGPEMMTALRLAVLRGVDVQIIVAGRTDNRLSEYAAVTYINEALASGITVYQYQNGFLHQKAFLVDDDIATITTANFDRRSFGLNFEISAIVRDKSFNAAVAHMFKADFARSTQAKLAERLKTPFHRRLLARTARLLTPIL